MVAVFTLLFTLAISLLIVRIATVALAMTGLSHEAARFQARSALTGTGFTTAESENVVNHPVRRRIIMTLMIIRNGGIVTIIAISVLTVVDLGPDTSSFLRIGLLIVGLALLWIASMSSWVDRYLRRGIDLALRRWAHLDTRDYAALLHLRRDYRVAELRVVADDWLAGKTLQQLRLTEEGLLVLGVERRDDAYIGAPGPETRVEAGDTLLIYGLDASIRELDEREAGPGGNLKHVRAVSRHHAERGAEHAAARDGDGSGRGAASPGEATGPDREAAGPDHEAAGSRSVSD